MSPWKGWSSSVKGNQAEIFIGPNSGKKGKIRAISCPVSGEQLCVSERGLFKNIGLRHAKTVIFGVREVWAEGKGKS